MDTYVSLMDAYFFYGKALLIRKVIRNYIVSAIEKVYLKVTIVTKIYSAIANFKCIS